MKIIVLALLIVSLLVFTLLNQGSSSFLLYVKQHPSGAYLTDFSNDVIHEWNTKRFYGKTFSQVCQRTNNLEQFSATRDKIRDLYHVEPLEDGSLLTLWRFRGIAKLTWDGVCIWGTEGKFHHDLTLSSDNQYIYTLERFWDYVQVPGQKAKVKAKVDRIVKLSSEGKVIKKVKIDSLLGEPPIHIQRIIVDELHEADISLSSLDHDDRWELSHCNSIETVKTAIPKIAQVGDIIINCLKYSKVFIVDKDLQKVKWKKGLPPWNSHAASVTSRGTILLLANKYEDTRSRIVEIDPISKNIIWSFSQNSPEFFSETKGGVEEMRPDLFLIMLPKSGRAYVVDRAKKVHWTRNMIKKFPQDKREGALGRLRLIDQQNFPEWIKLLDK